MQNLKSTCTKCTKEYKHNIIDTKYFFLKNKTNLFFPLFKFHFFTHVHNKFIYYVYIFYNINKHSN